MGKRTVVRRMGEIIYVYMYEDDIIVKILGYNRVCFDRRYNQAA